MHFNNLLLLSVSLATAQGYVAPRNGGSSNSFLSLFNKGGSSSGSSSCQKDSCYNDIFSRKDNGFCRQFNSPSSCNLPSDLSKYSSKKDSVRSACNCYLQQSTQAPTSTHAQPTNTNAPSCVKDDCYNDIFNRKDNGFCRQYNSPSSCNLPSDLSKYSGNKDSVRSACNCYLQHQTTPTNGPTTASHPVTTSGPSSPGHTVTVTGPEYDYTVTVSPSQPAHTVTVSGPSQPAHTVTVSGPSQPARTVTVSGPSQPAHTITVSAPATKTCPSASKITETCTVTKTQSFTAQATCSSHSASVVTKTCTVTKTVSGSGTCSTHTS